MIGFFFPVVPKGQARIRVQLSAAHEQHHLDKAIEAFARIGKELEVIGPAWILPVERTFNTNQKNKQS